MNVITVSPTVTDLLNRLIQDLGVLVSRDELRDCLPDRDGGASRNAIDLHTRWLGKRIQPIERTIRIIWGRGYLLILSGSES